MLGELRDAVHKFSYDDNVICIYVNEIEQQNRTMLEGLIWFVKRVRSGEVRSKKTYAKFVELIESATGLSIEEVLLK